MPTIHTHKRTLTPQEFNDDPRITKEFGKDFEVEMGFGMHIGWAIEGAIGSKFKVRPGNIGKEHR